MNARGFTLVETLCALAIMSMVVLGVAPTFHALMEANTLTEQRSGAVAAGQQVLESLREQSPASMPSSGSDPVRYIDVGQYEYEVVVHYCIDTTYCHTNMRHIVAEVNFAGKKVYTLETVYTRLQ